MLVKLLLFAVLMGHTVLAQNGCKPTFIIEHTDFEGRPKGLQGIELYLIKADSSKVPIATGQSNRALIGTGFLFKSKGREFYFPYSSIQAEDICITDDIRYVYKTEDSSGVARKTFLTLEYVGRGETFFLCNEVVSQRKTRDVLKEKEFELVDSDSSYAFFFKRVIPDVREHFRKKGTEQIDLAKIGNPFEEDITIEVPRLLNFQSAEWGADSFAYTFVRDPRETDDYTRNNTQLQIHNDWNNTRKPLLCVDCSTLDSTLENGQTTYFGISDTGLYWKYYYHKNFGILYVNVRKEDKALFDYALQSFRVGAEIDRKRINAKKR